MAVTLSVVDITLTIIGLEGRVKHLTEILADVKDPIVQRDYMFVIMEYQALLLKYWAILADK